MPADLKTISRVRVQFFPLVVFILAGFLISPSAFAKTKKKSTHSTKRATHSAPAKYVPPASGFTTVVIDAGHGGFDPGGIPGQRIPEKPYTLDTARRLQSYLSRAGMRTVMTRTNDTFIPLPERVRIANAQRNAIFVSIHFNSSPTSSGYGIETYYYASNAGSLALRIQTKVMQAIRTQNRGVKRRGYYVLRNPNIAAVLVEGGFLTNPEEARSITTASYRQRLAEAIGRAILDQR